MTECPPRTPSRQSLWDVERRLLEQAATIRRLERRLLDQAHTLDAQHRNMLLDRLADMAARLEAVERIITRS
jgi:uncharacterized membrane protein YgcG